MSIWHEGEERPDRIDGPDDPWDDYAEDDDEEEDE